MKPITKAVVIFLGIVFCLTGCSRKKDTFLSRNYHAVTTEYNTLYNGDVALQNGLKSVNNAFTENFWELLPIERFEVKDEVRLDSEGNNSDFERAEEKAIKAIQKHSMNIGGREKNPQIDEAYLMLGKARYYDQRFVPALAAFNNILNRYPSSDKINQVKVWREKTNMRLGNDELAIKNLRRHLDQEEIEGQDLADISAVLAEAFLNLEQKDSTMAYITVAAEETKIKEQKARYHFIRGQLYSEFGKKDSANLAFDEIIEMHRKIPRAFYINAHLAKAANFDADNGDKLAFQEYLAELEENRENRPFLNKIYYQIAEYHLSQGSDSIAEAYYNKSLRANTGDKTLNARNYLTLGDMYFDRTIYKTAGAYYDSTLTNMVQKSKPYRVTSKKRENLEDVILYEGIAKTNDSILRLVNMPKEDRLALFSKYIDELKAADEAQAEQDKKDAIILAQATAKNVGNTPGFQRRGPGLPGANAGGPGASGDFYFYNPTTVAYGKNEFQRLWGDRKLQDNWRLSDKRGTDATDAGIEDVIATATDEDRYNPEFYIGLIPTEQTAIDSLAKDRNYAYYQLGLIYKEKFKEYELAKSRLQNLLKFNPEERLILPTKYNLQQIYEALGQTGEADIAKNEIISNFPDSRYAEILRNPQSQLAKDENSPESVYEATYAQFEEQNYAQVIQKADESIKNFEGDAFVPKFEILKASAIGRLQGFEAYKESVNYIALTYPSTEEGKRAQEILTTALPALESREFIPDEDQGEFKVVYQFDNTSKETVLEFIKNLETEIAKTPLRNLTVSEDVYNANTTFVVVHGMEFLTRAKGFTGFLEEYKDKESKDIARPFFVISSPNYAIVQRHKNLDQFLTPQ
ncbi:tetratricopeptide repeat protein [Winogradskyella maritima]|uniref:Tetratricopeptide repeat protein n=1 Tax=Winogradskyella maritima TaxID=1517766 RepID=A0ABV8AEL1_9FLAO|nr:tetratricopeptide repeat protein [Winogradskyella maritima]